MLSGNESGTLVESSADESSGHLNDQESDQRKIGVLLWKISQNTEERAGDHKSNCVEDSHLSFLGPEVDTVAKKARDNLEQQVKSTWNSHKVSSVVDGESEDFLEECWAVHDDELGHHKFSESRKPDSEHDGVGEDLSDWGLLVLNDVSFSTVNLFKLDFGHIWVLGRVVSVEVKPQDEQKSTESGVNVICRLPTPLRSTKLSGNGHGEHHRDLREGREEGNEETMLFQTGPVDNDQPDSGEVGSETHSLEESSNN